MAVAATAVTAARRRVPVRGVGSGGGIVFGVVVLIVMVVVVLRVGRRRCLLLMEGWLERTAEVAGRSLMVDWWVADGDERKTVVKTVGNGKLEWVANCEE